MGAREEQQDRFVARAVGLDPGRVLADARNAAHDYVADGIDAVETVLRHELDWRVEAKARALEGLERVHERLQDALRLLAAGETDVDSDIKLYIIGGQVKVRGAEWRALLRCADLNFALSHQRIPPEAPMHLFLAGQC